MKKCKIEWCDNKHSAKGYCKNHYWSFKIYGDPLKLKFKNRGDNNTLAWENRLCSKNRDGYLIIKTHKNNRNYTQQLHRCVWEKYNGTIPKGYHIHHINKIKTDNRIENLLCLSNSDHHKLHDLDRNKKEV